MYHVLCWFIVSNRYLLFWVSNGHNSVTVQNRTHVYMNFFDHKDQGNHLLQLCPKVVKHPVFALSSRLLVEEWDLYRSAAKDSFLLGCDAVLSGELFKRFWRVIFIFRTKLDHCQDEGATVLWNNTHYDTASHLKRPGFSNTRGI